MNILKACAIPLLTLSACAPAVTITSRTTGQLGSGTLENIELGNSGRMTIALGNEQFTGTWLAVRDSGILGIPANGGIGNAVLHSDQGSRMTCEFRYSMGTYTALGTCLKNESETFDMQATLI